MVSKNCKVKPKGIPFWFIYAYLYVCVYMYIYLCASDNDDDSVDIVDDIANTYWLLPCAKPYPKHSTWIDSTNPQNYPTS